MNTSVAELRKNMKKVLTALDRKESITIFYRGKARGKLVPIEEDKQTRKSAEHPAFGMWKDRLEDKDVPEMVRRLRKGRFDAL
jgi:antitoxin (DNA-binding transcriptional repressor) of toxin-antitoxin stability system